MNKLIALCFIVSCAPQSLDVLDGFSPTLVSKSYPIIGGVPAGSLPEHDAVVGLHRLTRRRGGSVYIYPFCTGTLITSSVVLTAAHCLDKSEDFAPTEPWKANELAVYFGDAPAELDENGFKYYGIGRN